MLYGIDHASHQGLIDMARLKALGHTFAIGKCTGEGNYINPNYAENHRRAIAAGMVPGSYDWVEPQDARAGDWLAADYLRCVDALGGRPAGHQLGVDFETEDWFKGPRGRNIEPFMRQYIFTLLDLSQQGIEFYTGPYFMQETGAVNWTWLRHPKIRLWLAAPGAGMMADDSFWPQVDIRPFTEVGIHQHQWHATDRAIGSGAEFDRNRFRGTVFDLKANGAKGGDDWTFVPEQKGENVPEELTVAVPPGGKWSMGILPNGESYMILNFGGQTRKILGAEIVDVGMTVESATEEGVSVSMSFRDEAFTGYQENRGGTLPG